MTSSRVSDPSLIVAGLLAAGMLTAPAFAGPPFRTDDPVPTDFQHFEIYLFSEGEKAIDGWTGTLPGLEVNYGALPNLQLSVTVGQGYAAPVEGRTSFAFEDVLLGAKYRFITPGEDDWFPQVAFYPAVLVPTGNQKFGFSSGHVQYFLPLWLQKDFGLWTVYGGGGYWINPGAGNKNYGFTGVAVWRKIGEQLSIGAEIFHETLPSTGAKDSTGFNVGAIYDFSENWHLLGSAGTGLRNRPETNQFSYYLGVLLTF